MGVFGVARWPTLQSAAASGVRVGGLAYVCMFICDVTFWPVVLLPTGTRVCECVCVCAFASEGVRNERRIGIMNAKGRVGGSVRERA